MFGGGTSTEYEEIVSKTTDENLTSENWEMIMNLCDKVQEEGQSGAHAVIAAILKRLAHRNPNVQLYALSLTEALSKNLSIEIHREIASRAFTQGLERLIVDRNTHEKVRKRALGLVAMWTAEFENNTDLGLMEECYNNLKAKNYKFTPPTDPPPPTIDDEARRREEEELQRVLEMSMQDRGGRNKWGEYSLAGSSSAAASSSAAGSSSSAGKGATSTGPFAQPKYSGGYVPARTPSPSPVANPVAPVSTQAANAAAERQRQQAAQYHAAQAVYAQGQQQALSGGGQGGYPSRSSSLGESTPVVPTAAVSAVPATTSPAPTIPTSTTPVPSSSQPPSTQIPSLSLSTRVRALHTFTPSEPGELAFEKGDVIKVVDRGYKDWWRGQLKGRTGIFPVNYVEPLPEPTPAELTLEAQSEAQVFSQAVQVEKLLAMLRALDPEKDNLADNEEIQELYRQCMGLRPKIVRLIERYSQKRADLVSMNETFVRARTIFDRMMEESLARHAGVYDQTYRPPPGPQYRPESAAGGRPGPQQPYGWNPAPAAIYEGYTAPVPPGPVGYNVGVPVPHVAPGPGPAPAQGVAPGAQDPQMHGPAPYGGVPVGTPGQVQPQGQPGYVNGAANVGPQTPGGLPYGVAGGPYAGGVYAQAAPQHQVQPQQGPVYGAAPGGPQPQPQQQQPGQGYQQPQQQQPGQGYPQQQQQPAQGYPPQQQQQQASPPLGAVGGGGTSPQQTHLQPQSLFEYQQQQQQAQPATSQPQQQAGQLQAQPTTHVQPQVQQPGSQQPQTTAQTQAHPQPEPAQPQPQPAQTQPQPQPQLAAQAQAQPAPQQPISGPPPYPYDPSYTYADPNVQAWAQYYAAGGKEMAGAVYFLSIPGLTDGATTAAATGQGQVQGQGQGQGAVGGGQGQQQQQQLGETQPAQSHVQGQQGEQPYGVALNPAAATSSVSLGSAPTAARAASPIQGQQQQQRPVAQYQLSDPGPIQQVQTQPQPIGQAQTQGPPPAQYANYQQPSSSLTDVSTSGLKQSSPTGAFAPGHSPTSSMGSTPAWVLPKKTGPTTPGGPATGLASQLGGITLSDQ